MSGQLVPQTAATVENRYNHRIELITSLESIPEAELAPLTADRTFYVSRPWLLQTERLRGGGTAYVVTRNQDGELLGVLPVYWGKASARGYYEPYNRFLLRSGGDFQESDWSPTYVIGSRTAYSCEFLLAPVLTQEERKQVLSGLIRYAQDHAASCGAASVSSLYMTNEGRKQLAEVVGEDAGFFLAGANSVITVRWNSLEEYLAETKTSIRRERVAFEARGYNVVSRSLEESIDTIAQLLANLESKYGHKASAEGEARELRALAAVANHLSNVLILEYEGRAVGCILLFLYEGTIYGRSAGFDYDVTGDAFEYFNLAYYEVIRLAIEKGYKRIDYGMATYRAKLARGAKVEPLWGIVSSSSASSPAQNAEFAAWNQLREEAIKQNDPILIERSQIP